MAHTPGPWRVQTEDGRLEIRANQGPLEVCPARVFGGPSDGKLIAAAPDLLLAVKCLCEEMADYMRLNSLGDPNKKHNYRLGMAALAKAGALLDGVEHRAVPE